MSEINYQALREAAQNAKNLGGIKNYKRGEQTVAEFESLITPHIVLALLDELKHYKSREERVTKLVMDNSTSWDALYKKLEAAEKRNAELQSENAYIRNRYKELDLLIGKNILVMQAAIIEWQATGDAKSGLAWIYNTLFCPGELPNESEKDAQAYFNRKYAQIDEKLMELHKWFWEQSEAERAAGIRIKGE
ncbi:ead/Ea22-like family protein [Escherichia coli]|uniref:ead/Ea22-like family protein n=1 Tax=Escherichia coli TaxID=562 RepID=UPI000BE5A7A2